MKLHYTFILSIIMGTSFSLHGWFAHYYGVQAYANNNSTRACEYLGTCIAHNPHDWRALCNLGTIAFNEQNYTDAIKHFNKTLEINPHCQEARERRDAAEALLKKQEEQKQEQGQQKQDTPSPEDQNNAQNNSKSQDNNSDNKNQSHEQNQKSSNRNQESEQQQGNEQQEEEKNKFNQQEYNKKEQDYTPEQQETQREKSQDSKKESKEANHATSQNQQRDKNLPQYNEQVDKIKKASSLTKLTPREQKIINKVEETDKAAQEYMIMNTRKTGQHDTQNDW